MTSPLQPDPPAPGSGPPADVSTAGVLAVAATLAEALKGMSAELKAVNEASVVRDDELKRYGRRSRLFILVDVLLTVISTVAVVFALHASSTADQTQQASATSCASGNVTRETLTQVFNHIFAAFTGPVSETAAQRAAAQAKIAGIEAYYKGKFAPRNCTAIYGVKPEKTPAASSPR